MSACSHEGGRHEAGCPELVRQLGEALVRAGAKITYPRVVRLGPKPRKARYDDAWDIAGTLVSYCRTPEFEALHGGVLVEDGEEPRDWFELVFLDGRRLVVKVECR